MVNVKEQVVIYATARNVFDDPIYFYIKLPLEDLKKLKKAMDSGRDFMPAHYGEVLAAGLGEPTPEVKSEMAIKYDLIDLPKPAPQNTLNFPTPDEVVEKATKRLKKSKNIDVIPAVTFNSDDGGSLWGD